MGDELQLEVVPAGDAVWIRVRGDLDDATAPELVATAATAPPADRLVIDLSPCTFLDSGGIRGLVAIDRAHRERATVVVLCPPDGPCRLVLDIVGLADAIALVDHAEQVPLAEAPPVAPASPGDDGEPDASPAA